MNLQNQAINNDRESDQNLLKIGNILNKMVLPQYDVKIISLVMKNVLFILFAVEFFISVSKKSLDMFLVIHELNSPLKLLYNN